ncbi:helix-turn-helix transcriptional regulator [Caulobacter sp. RHG1]|uniref:helix-turn-helix domain-containing protein n=1 Tax=Caulobacter sp. (strain RHG1) TaxID=2545762 RepID=UPI00155747DA|nr:helix-turn-helix transcriptional regulator [Caulobacter sp. RHG1]NQE61397.1 Transcriptional regulator, Xre family [Caulobacter sp. RHG1]
MAPDTTPHFVDLHVGARLRMRRRALARSQGAVAQAVGLTFQQLQKYERGANRISASKLHALAAVLQTSVAWFFEGLPDPMSGEDAPDGREGPSLHAFFLQREGFELAKAFPALSPDCKATIIALARSLADEAET